MPQRLTDIVINPPWDLTSDGRPYLLVNDGNDDKMLIFCTVENLQRLHILHIEFERKRNVPNTLLDI